MSLGEQKIPEPPLPVGRKLFPFAGGVLPQSV